MPEMPLVTIAIASFNYDRFVGQAVRSALVQSHPRTEVIVVDDGSEDNSREIIAAEVRESDRPAMMIFKENAGHASVYNVAFARGSGDVFVFLDADDILLPDAAATIAQSYLADYRENDPRPVSRWSWQMPVIGAHGTDPAAGARLEPHTPPADDDQLEMVIRQGPPVPGSSPASGCAWPRWFLRRTLPMPEPMFRRAADSYLNTLAPLYGRVRRIDRPLSSYREHGSNFWASRSVFGKARIRSQRLLAKRQVLSQHLERLGLTYNASHWQQAHPKEQYWDLVERLERQLLDFLPPGEPFILADQDELNAGTTFHGRRRYHLMERQGLYWGLPASDVDAIAQLEQHREAGATNAVFLWPAFWWFGHYTHLAHHLSRYTLRESDEKMRLYRLR